MLLAGLGVAGGMTILGAGVALGREDRADPVPSGGRAAAPSRFSGSVRAPDPADLDQVTLPERYELAETWNGGAGRRLYHPWGIDVGSDGIYVVAERGGNRITGFHADGRGAFGWDGGAGPAGGAGPSQFRTPEDVAVDVSLDRVWVADTGNRRVQILSRRSGAYVDQWTDVGLPRGIASGIDGTVVVADAEGDRLLVFPPDGSGSRTIGGPGRDPGRFDEPLGIALAPNGLIYVADSGNRRVQWLDLDGNFEGELDLDASDGPGGVPLDVSVHEDGTMYVAVERGLLRFRGPTTYGGLIAPMEPAPGEVVPMVNTHEGVRGVGVRSGVGMAFTWSPATRATDRVMLMPERWFPALALGSTGLRGMDDPARLDGGGAFAHVLDSSGTLRIFEGGGVVYDGYHAFQGGPGTDIAGQSDISVVLINNTVECTWITCFANCPTLLPYEVLSEGMTQRQDCRGFQEPDDVWWNRAVAAVTADRHAVLNAGYGSVVIRQVGVESPLGVVRLGPRTQAFKAYSDIAYDRGGNLRILGRDGLIKMLDPMGRALPDMTLALPEGLSAESFDISDAGEVFVLAHNETVLKFDATGGLRAAWSIPGVVGPGSYTDLAIGPDGKILVPDGAGDRILAFHRVTGTSELPGPAVPPCRLVPSKTASPSRLPLGGTTEVSLGLQATCTSDAMDIVLVVQADCAMSGERLRMLRESALGFAGGLKGDRRVAVVTFADEFDARYGGARLTMPFTADRSTLAQGLGAVNTTCLPLEGRRVQLEEALGLARETLTGPDARPDAEKAVIVIAPGRSSRDLVLWETRALWRIGARVYTVAVGRDRYCAGLPPDTGLLAAMAVPPSGFRSAETPDALPAIFEDLAEELSGGAALESVEIVDRIPSNMRLVPGSVVPATDLLPDGTLHWQLDTGAATWSIHFQLEPLAAGIWPTNVQANALYRERGAERVVVFPVPVVDVYLPEPTPTDVPSATATPIASNTATATTTAESTSTPLRPPTLTPRPSLTPPPAAPVVYLPYAEKRDSCQTTARPVDVALVVDGSSSMAGAKLDAARIAASSFIDLMNLPRDHAAIVSFSNEARVMHQLTGDRTALHTALLGLTTSAGTRIDVGLAEGIRLVAGPGARPEADPVVVLLTDGRPDGGTEAQLLAVARLGRDLAVTTYAVGLGADVDAALLKEIAGRDDGYFFAPGPADLERIYAAVARRIPCR